MRVRTLFTLAVGAAAGAAAAYLLDPEHGPQRRREACRDGVQLVRSGAQWAVTDGRRQAEELVAAAAAGYRQSRATSPDGFVANDA